VRVERETLCHNVLRPAVKQDDGEGDQEVEGTRGVFGHSEF
jgi:hypothetical protein